MNTPRENATFQEESFYAEDFDGINNCLKVDSVGVYAHDRYDFIDRGFFETKIRSQDLGAWNKKKNTVSMFWGGDTVQNKTFREYQKKSGKGGDFDVFSDLKITALYDWQKFTVPLELKK